MAAAPGVRALFGLHRSGMLQRSFGVTPAYLASTCLPMRLCSSTTKSNAPKQPVIQENEGLLQNLNLMGVDVRKVRQRQPGVLRKTCTNEQGLARFLQRKGASQQVIASIISRYPRAITRSIEHMEQRWQLWRNVFLTDEEIVTILDRSPESFFRSSDNENLKDNISFLTSLGFKSKDLHRLLTTAPRTFSNSLELNKQMFIFLKDICAELGGTNPEQFAKSVISRNLYILIRSTKRVRATINNLKTSLNLDNSELLTLLEGPGSEILDLSGDYLKNNFSNLQQKLAPLGCQEAQIKKLVISYPMILYIGTDTLNSKIDCLLKGGITIKQILEKPKVLEYSTQNITGRLEELKRVGYDFQKNGINILDSSRKRFVAKMERLASPDNTL